MNLQIRQGAESAAIPQQRMEEMIVQQRMLFRKGNVQLLYVPVSKSKVDGNSLLILVLKVWIWLVRPNFDRFGSDQF